MAPSLTETVTEVASNGIANPLKLNKTASSNHREPLKYSGSLDEFESFEATTVIGREYPTMQLSDLMTSPRRDEYIRDLAITVSQRGVVFLRKQKDLTVEMQKEFIDLLGRLSGKPATSGLHVHPLIEGKKEVGVNDMGDRDEHISVISSVVSQKLHGEEFGSRYTNSSRGWHSDMTFEHVPSDYAVLKMRVTPKMGGDTLWASAYEVYDRLSGPVQRFLEGLTCLHANPDFIKASQRNGFQIHPGPRGAAENVGQDLLANHPVIRTNPISGWKSVYGALNQIQHINEITKQESDEVLRYLGRIVTENHDLQVRYHWGVDDVAIWDNRSTFHTGTGDVAVGDVRTGNRAVSMGEVPYLDPSSTSRREALGQL